MALTGGSKSSSLEDVHGPAEFQAVLRGQERNISDSEPKPATASKALSVKKTVSTQAINAHVKQWAAYLKDNKGDYQQLCSWTQKHHPHSTNQLLKIIHPNNFTASDPQCRARLRQYITVFLPSLKMSTQGKIKIRELQTAFDVWEQQVLESKQIQVVSKQVSAKKASHNIRKRPEIYELECYREACKLYAALNALPEKNVDLSTLAECAATLDNFNREAVVNMKKVLAQKKSGSTDETTLDAKEEFEFSESLVRQHQFAIYEVVAELYRIQGDISSAQLQLMGDIAARLKNCEKTLRDYQSAQENLRFSIFYRGAADRQRLDLVIREIAVKKRQVLQVQNQLKQQQKTAAAAMQYVEIVFIPPQRNSIAIPSSSPAAKAQTDAPAFQSTTQMLQKMPRVADSNEAKVPQEAVTDHVSTVSATLVTGIVPPIPGQQGVTISYPGAGSEQYGSYWAQPTPSQAQVAMPQHSVSRQRNPQLYPSA